MDIIQLIRNRARREEIYSNPDYWNSRAKGIHSDSTTMWPNNCLNELYHDETIRIINCFLPESDEDISILDAGCGTGRLSYYLASRGAKVLGLDFSEKLIEIAKRNTNASNPTFKVGSILEINDQDEYNLVVSWGTLCMACKNKEDVNTLFQRLHKAIIPGGAVLLLEPIHQGFLHRVLNMSINDFTDIMMECGFKIESVIEMHYWPARVLLAFVPWPAFITKPIYLIGQWLMQRGKQLGDYKAIYART